MPLLRSCCSSADASLTAQLLVRVSSYIIAIMPQLTEPNSPDKFTPRPQRSHFRARPCPSPRLIHIKFRWLFNLIVTCAGHFITHARRGKFFPCGIIPCSKTSMHIKILLRYGVRTYNDLDLIAFFKEGFECVDIGAGRITNHQTGSYNE